MKLVLRLTCLDEFLLNRCMCFVCKSIVGVMFFMGDKLFFCSIFRESDGHIFSLSQSPFQFRKKSFIGACIKTYSYVRYFRFFEYSCLFWFLAVGFCLADVLPDERIKRARHKKKPNDFSYHKWAHLGVPMLISAGDDTKLFAYPVKEFLEFSPHDICPAPQRTPIQLALNTSFNQSSMFLVQSPHQIDVHLLHIRNVRTAGGFAKTEKIAQVKKASSKIICSTLADSGVFFAYSDHEKPSLFELKRCEDGKTTWRVCKRKLPKILPFAHSLVFTHDSSWLVLAGHDRRIYVS